MTAAGTGTRGRKTGYRLSNWLTNRITAVSEGAATLQSTPPEESSTKLTGSTTLAMFNAWLPEFSRDIDCDALEVLGVVSGKASHVS